MVLACAQNGLVEEAGRLFTQMKEAAVELDVAAVVSILAACAVRLACSLEEDSPVRADETTREVHQRLQCTDCHVLQVRMPKAGKYVFETEIVEKDAMSWNTIIGGLQCMGMETRRWTSFLK